MVSNGPMCESFRENWAALGQPDWPSVEEDKAKALSGGGSTDMGNMCALNASSSSHPSLLPSLRVAAPYLDQRNGSLLSIVV